MITVVLRYFPIHECLGCLVQLHCAKWGMMIKRLRTSMRTGSGQCFNQKLLSSQVHRVPSSTPGPMDASTCLPATSSALFRLLSPTHPRTPFFFFFLYHVVLLRFHLLVYTAKVNLKHRCTRCGFHPCLVTTSDKPHDFEVDCRPGKQFIRP